MPYVLRDIGGFITTIMINPIDENTEFVTDVNDDVTFFNLKKQLYLDLIQEYDSRCISVTINAINWPICSLQCMNNHIKSLMAAVSLDLNVTLLDIDGSDQTMLTATAVALTADICDYSHSVDKHEKSLRAEIDGAATLAALQAIDVTVGWPEIA